MALAIAWYAVFLKNFAAGIKRANEVVLTAKFCRFLSKTVLCARMFLPKTCKLVAFVLWQDECLLKRV